jgi:hypothetical protein
MTEPYNLMVADYGSLELRTLAQVDIGSGDRTVQSVYHLVPTGFVVDEITELKKTSSLERLTESFNALGNATLRARNAMLRFRGVLPDNKAPRRQRKPRSYRVRRRTDRRAHHAAKMANRRKGW